MLAITIPVSERAPLVRQRVELEGVEFVLETQWNGRVDGWTLGLLDAEEQPIRLGIRLVMGTRLLAGIADSRRPAGELVVVGRVTRPELDSFELGEASLVYLLAAEVEEALA